MEYEGLFIIKPDLSEEEQKQVMDAITSTIEKSKGQIKNTQNLGKKQLAYEIKKQKNGNYQLIIFEAPSGTLSGLKKAFKLNTSILRHLILKKEK